MFASAGSCDAAVVATTKSRKLKGRTWRSQARSSPDVKRALVCLGERVRELRLERELTQQETAERALIDDKHLQAVEAGKTNPTVATLVGIARALDVDLASLFRGE